MELHSRLKSALSNANRLPHDSAIRTKHNIEPEIYQDLFHNLFHGKAQDFARWQLPKSHHHLRYFGGPGSGKTTFTALAAEKLRANYASSARDVVATIFVSERVEWNELTREEALEALFLQLCTADANEPSPACLASYKTFVQKIQCGDAPADRLIFLRLTLNARIANLDHAFVLLDGLDRCGPSAALEPELACLGPKVKLLSTSRVFAPKLDVFLREWWPRGQVNCDAVTCLNGGLWLEKSAYWACRNSHKTTILCWSCYEDEETSCSLCHERKHFEQSPQVFINITDVTKFRLRRYLGWEMEREHGHLGLRSDASDVPLSLSRLGRRLMSPGNDALARKELETVFKRSDGNIAIARLRMEILHVGFGSLKTDEGLPREIVALFNAVVDGCSELGIRAIAATSYLLPNQPGMPCVPIAKLEAVLGLESDIEGVRLELLHSAKGVLVATAGFGLGFYNGVFRMYAKHSYNMKLQEAQAGMLSALAKMVD